jgi:hypothetical protein
MSIFENLIKLGIQLPITLYAWGPMLKVLLLLSSVFAIFSFQNCGKGFSAATDGVFFVNSSPNSSNQSNDNAENTQIPEAPLSNEVAPPIIDAPPIVVEEPAPSNMSSSTEPKANSTDPQDVTTNTPVMPTTPTPVMPTTPTPVMPTTPAPVMPMTPTPVNTEKIITQIPAEITEPSVIMGNAIINIASTTPPPSPMITFLPGNKVATAVFCLAGHINMANKINGEKLTLGSNMLSSLNKEALSYCNTPFTIGNRLKIKSILRIKGNLTVNGPIEIQSGGALIVEGEYIHLGEQSSNPGLIYIQNGGLLAHNVTHGRFGAPGLRQNGIVFLIGEYKTGVWPKELLTFDAEHYGPQKVSLDINLSSPNGASDLLDFNFEEI